MVPGAALMFGHFRHFNFSTSDCNDYYNDDQNNDCDQNRTRDRQGTDHIWCHRISLNEFKTFAA